MGAPMTTRMHDAQAVLLRGKLYVRGGYSMSLTPEVDNSNDEYVGRNGYSCLLVCTHHLPLPASPSWWR